jgi:hypothetical protein
MEEQISKHWDEIVGRAWTDDRFRLRLLNSPEQALKEFGINLAPGTSIQFFQDTEKTMHLILPDKP